MTRVEDIQNKMWKSVFDQIEDMKDCEMTEKEIRRLILRDVTYCLDASF